MRTASSNVNSGAEESASGVCAHEAENGVTWAIRIRDTLSSDVFSAERFLRC
jgi:hypothetical protein